MTFPSELCTPFSPETRMGLFEVCVKTVNEHIVSTDCHDWAEFQHYKTANFQWSLKFVAAMYIIVSFTVESEINLLKLLYLQLI